jgi:hypothetical protein
MTRTFSVCLLVFLGLPAAAQTPSVQKTPAESSVEQKPAAPVCIYSSRNYSEGATVCVQKSLMLKCVSDGTKALWSQVDDKTLSDKCLTPARGTVYQQCARWHRQNIRRQITPSG